MTRWYRIAVRAYPPRYRREHGDELIGTATDLHPHRWSAQEACSLVTNGLRTRCREASGHSARGALLSGVRFALALSFLVPTAIDVAGRTGAMRDVTVAGGRWFAVATLATTGLLLRTTRWPAAAAITALSVAQIVGELTGHDRLAVTGDIGSAIVVTAIGWWVCLAGDGRRAMRPRAGLAIVAAFVATSAVTNHGGALTVLGLVGMILLGMALVTIDPRPLIAATTLLLVIGSVYANGGLPDGPHLVPSVIVAGLVVTLAALSWSGARRLDTD